MKLAEMKAKRKVLMDARTALQAEAKKMYEDACVGGKAPSAEELAAITAKREESGKGLSEISALDDFIAREEGLARPARHNSLISEIDSGGDNFREQTRRVRAYGRPKYIGRAQGVTAEQAKEIAYRAGVALAYFAAAKSRHTIEQAAWAKERLLELGMDPKAIHQEDGAFSGAALVPSPLLNEVIDLRETFGTFRQNTRVLQMTADTLAIPRRLTGLTYYWVGEGGTITSSSKTWDRPMLVAKKLAGLAVSTNEFSEDAIISIADDLIGELAYALSSGEDDAGWLGDGTSAYGGITGVVNKLFNLSATVSQIAGVQVTTGTGSYAGAVIADWNNFLGLLPLYADTPACRIFTSRQYFFQNMQRLAIAAGGTQATEIVDGVRRQMFLGYPVVFVQKLPRYWAIDQCVALFGDLGKASKMGDRRQAAIEESTDATIDGVSMFTNDERAWRIAERIDINVHDVGNASGTASLKNAGPIVGMFTAHT